MSALLDALRAERDAALEEAAFERGRATQALKRNQTLRQDLARLRERLAGHLGQGSQPVAVDPERLRLALDTSLRLERIRAHLERQLVEAVEHAETAQQEVSRLQLRVRALEGELKLRR